MIRPAVLAAGALLLGGATYLSIAYIGVYGQLETAGDVTATPRPAAFTEENNRNQQAAAQRVDQGQDHSQILFGDLHVHTTFSIDAFQASLAMMGGEGAHPPADACDFARFCSALDFWSINDHAENTTPDHWMETKESIRQCNAVAGDPLNPDLVAFTGFEWTQSGLKQEEHYGHKNVIFKDTDESQLPTRPIYADAPGMVVRTATGAQRLAVPLMVPSDRQRGYDFNALTDEVYRYPECPKGVDVRDLPVDCREGAQTPKELFAKLDQWGFDTMVIPHGNSWGIYTPAGSTWDKQLKDGNQNSQYQFLMETFSGHGNSEEYRDWRGTEIDEYGNLSCPEPTLEDGKVVYTPTCWRAGELIQQRCEAEGETETECESRAEQARQIFVYNGVGGHNVVGGDWQELLESGQCTDCYLPAFNFRPGGSAQYALSITNFDNPENPERFNFGFIASSDNHSGRPGTGYKELDRYEMADTAGVQHSRNRKVAYPKKPYSSTPALGDFISSPPPMRFEHERASSFYYTGGLVAVHANGRDRDSIWNALENKQVYGTSGERILLWFDLLNSDQGKQPMGSEVSMKQTPRFKVSAVGAFKQKPGCPDYVSNTLTSERMETLCRGECYNPGDERKLIERIEIIRIRPQMSENEPMNLADGSSRIEDVWKTFECEPNQNGCSVEFEDPEFTDADRDFVYYARAIQEASPVINGDNLRTKYDEDGNPIEISPCYSDDRSDKSDDCLAMAEGRAWSSPIFVNHR